MPQKPIELILLKELASHLAMPVTIVDAAGNLVFFNRPAERLLGRNFDDTGEMPFRQFRELFRPVDSEGIPIEDTPMRITLQERRPQQGRFTIHEADGTPHVIATTSIPLDGQGGVPLGAMAIFWELDGATPSGVA